MRGLEGEIIVVDNASTEDCITVIRSSFPQVKLIENEENVGFSRAVNQGASIAAQDYLLVLNPDTVVSEDSLRFCLEQAESTPGTGAIGCRFVDGTGSFLPECKRNFPSMGAAFAKLLNLNWGYYAQELGEEENGEVEVLTGAFLFVRRELFNQLGGFDEDFFMFGEDIDLSYRIQAAGFKNRYLGELTTIHFKGESSLKDAEYMRHFYGALEIFYRKHFRHNALGRSMLKLLVNTAVRFRSKRTVVRPEAGKQSSESGKLEGAQLKTALYLGRRSNVFKDLKNQSDYQFGEMLSASDLSILLEEPKRIGSDQVFFDSSDLDFKQIIDLIAKLPKGVEKRIVSREGDFYVGSDSSRDRGEFGRLRQ